jgi:uroporphyrinogen-III synthase
MSSLAVHVRHEAGSRPLAGKRVVLTRPRAQAGEFEARIAALGGVPVIAPAIAIAAPDTWTVPDAALRRIGTYDWIAFTSANAVRALLDRSNAIGIDRDELRSRRLAVVGPTTAGTVAEALRQPDFMPVVHTAEALGRELVDVENARVLLPRGDLADGTLPDALRGRGAFVDEVVVYRTVPGDGLSAIVAAMSDATVDALLFTSASAVRFVAEAIVASGGTVAGHSPASPVVACLGQVTADAAHAGGFTNVIVADGASQSELIDRLARWFIRSDRGGSD